MADSIPLPESVCCEVSRIELFLLFKCLACHGDISWEQKPKAGVDLCKDLVPTPGGELHGDMTYLFRENSRMKRHAISKCGNTFSISCIFRTPTFSRIH
jgi:hypothetical protein